MGEKNSYFSRNVVTKRNNRYIGVIEGLIGEIPCLKTTRLDLRGETRTVVPEVMTGGAKKGGKIVEKVWKSGKGRVHPMEKS